MKKPTEARACFAEDLKASGKCVACLGQPAMNNCVGASCKFACQGIAKTAEGCGQCIIDKCKGVVDECLHGSTP